MPESAEDALAPPAQRGRRSEPVQGGGGTGQIRSFSGLDRAARSGLVRGWEPALPGPVVAACYYVVPGPCDNSPWREAAAQPFHSEVTTFTGTMSRVSRVERSILRFLR